jgi:Uma2 family endonuclease
MGAPKVLLTGEQFDNYDFQPDKRYELDDGVLLIEPMRPVYGGGIANRWLSQLDQKLGVYLQESKRGEALTYGSVFALGPLTRRAPYLAILLGDRSQNFAGAKVIHKVPDIVVEILWHSVTYNMFPRKRQQYFDAGVKEVWLIDKSEQEFEIWLGPSMPDRTLSLKESIESKLLPGFSLPIIELYGGDVLTGLKRVVTAFVRTLRGTGK